MMRPKILIRWLILVATLALGVGPVAAAENALADRGIVIVPREAELNPDLPALWVVAVGISDYKLLPPAGTANAPLADLQYADRDARAFAEFMRHQATLGLYRAAQVRELIDRQATREQVQLAIEEDLRQARRGDFVVIFFSGHGGQDNAGELCLLLWDSNPDNLTTTGYRMRELWESIKRRIDAEKVLVIADACFAGGIGRPGARGASPDVAAGFRQALGESSGKAVLSSTRAQTAAFEDAEFQQGIFTHYLLEGLGGAADANGDRTVLLSEAYNYLYDRVAEKTDRRQLPGMEGAQGPFPVAVTGEGVVLEGPAGAPVSARRAPGWAAIQYRYGDWLRAHNLAWQAGGLFDEIITSGETAGVAPETIRYAAGAVCWSIGEPERAEEYFSGLAADPRAQLMLVRTALERGDVQTALARAAALERIEGGERYLDDAYFTIAMALPVETKIPLLEDIASRYPDEDRHCNILYALGAEYLGDGEYAKAVKVFAQLEGPEFKNSPAHAEYGPPLNRLRNYAPQLMELLERQPRLADREYAQYAVGSYCYHSNQPETGAIWFQRVVDAYPNPRTAPELAVKALYSLGKSLFAIPRYGEADRAFERLVEKYPESSMADEAQWNRVLCAIRAGNDPNQALARVILFAAKYAGRDIGPEAFLETAQFFVDDEQMAANPVWHRVRAELLRLVFERSQSPDLAYWAGLKMHRELEAAGAGNDELREIERKMFDRFPAPPPVTRSGYSFLDW